MNKLLAALACCLFFSPTYASEPQASEIVRLMHFDRLAAHLVKTSLRERALRMGAPEKDLACMDTILPADFTDLFVKTVDAFFTADEQLEFQRFLQTPAGNRYASVSEAKINGKPKPEFTADESKAIAAFGETAAGKRLLDPSTSIGSDAVAERMAEVAKRTMDHCRQVMESRQP